MKVPIEKPGTPQELVEHFGIKGMHWGIRKEEDTSGRKPAKKISPKKEQRAKKHEANAELAQKQIDEIKANPSKWTFIQSNRELRAKELERYKNKELKAAKDIREDHLTDFQKKAIIGGAAVATILAAYGSYKLADSGTLTQILSRNKPLKKNELLSRKWSAEAMNRTIIKDINPGYGIERGTTMNCRRSTFAYELRRRGYDVKATRTLSGTGQNVAGFLNATDPNIAYKTDQFSIRTQLLKNEYLGKTNFMARAEKFNYGIGRIKVPMNPMTKTEDIFHMLSLEPEGARGELGVRWKHGGSHSMAWEIINGVPHVFDTQTGKHYPGRLVTIGSESSFTSDEFLRHLAPRIGEAGITRLDNVELNMKYLRRWVQNVK